MTFFEPREKQTVVLLSGYSGSGKTTLAGYLARNYGFTQVLAEDFHQERMRELKMARQDYYEWRATRATEEELRELRNQGVQFIKRNAQAKKVVVDWLNHPEELEEIRKKFPGSKILVVSLQTNKLTRMASRLARRRQRTSGKMPLLKHIILGLRAEKLLRKGRLGAIPEIAAQADFSVTRLPKPFSKTAYAHVDRIMTELGIEKTKTEKV